jgi:peptide/nickel transport system permease protein
MIEGYVQATSGQSYYKRKFKAVYPAGEKKKGKHVDKSDFQKVNM